MQYYNVEITETLSKTVEIQADTLDEALLIAKTMWNDESIILDNSDFVDYELNIVE